MKGSIETYIISSLFISSISPLKNVISSSVLKDDYCTFELVRTNTNSEFYLRFNRKKPFRESLIEIKEYISNIEKTRDSVEDVNREKFEV